ncbi:MAG: class I SAM-dependent methyltransferase [Pseudomonadota bacterium]
MRRQLRKLVRWLIPQPVIRFVWNGFSDLSDLPRRLAGRHPPQPFRVVHNVGGGDYHAIGRYYVDSISRRVDFKPGGHVLDIGCGTGRIAAPLIARMDAGGRYTGFDVSSRAIGWARRHVASETASVSFIHVDLNNSEYNRSGREKASAFRFPAENEDVDVAIATSLYSHLLADEAVHFLKETARVLKPGGRAVITAFLMTPEILERVKCGAAQVAFKPFAEGSYTTEPRTPEEAIAFDETLFFDWVRAAGLTSAVPVERGAWSSDKTEGALQDWLVLEKPGG